MKYACSNGLSYYLVSVNDYCSFTKIMKTPIFQRDKNCNILAVHFLRNCDVAFLSYFCRFLACSFLRRIYDSLCGIFSTFIPFLLFLCSHLFWLVSFCLLFFLPACLLACSHSSFLPFLFLSFLHFLLISYLPFWYSSNSFVLYFFYF